MFAKPPCKTTRPSRLLLVGLSAFVLFLVVGSLAIANIAPHAPLTEDLNGVSASEDHVDANDLPGPVVGATLFLKRQNSPECVDAEAVISTFVEDRNKIGGDIFELREGLGQQFADLWRARTGTGQTAVSRIVAHRFFDRSADEWTVDLVEFDTVGCAMSRTLLPDIAVEGLIALSAKA